MQTRSEGCEEMIELELYEIGGCVVYSIETQLNVQLRGKSRMRLKPEQLNRNNPHRVGARPDFSPRWNFIHPDSPGFMATIRFTEWRQLPVSITELCLETSLRCGQSFRYRFSARC